jgi:hypothetical protein
MRHGFFLKRVAFAPRYGWAEIIGRKALNLTKILMGGVYTSPMNRFPAGLYKQGQGDSGNAGHSHDPLAMHVLASIGSIRVQPSS